MCGQKFRFTRKGKKDITVTKKVCRVCGVWLDLDVYRREWFCPSCGHVYGDIEYGTKEKERRRKCRE